MTSLLVLLIAGPSPFRLCPPISMCDDLRGHLTALNSVCFCMLSLPYQIWLVLLPLPACMHKPGTRLAMSPHCSINSQCLLKFCKLGASSTRCQKHGGPNSFYCNGLPFLLEKMNKRVVNIDAMGFILCKVSKTWSTFDPNPFDTVPKSHNFSGRLRAESLKQRLKGKGVNFWGLDEQFSDWLWFWGTGLSY